MGKRVCTCVSYHFLVYLSQMFMCTIVIMHCPSVNFYFWLLQNRTFLFDWSQRGMGGKKGDVGREGKIGKFCLLCSEKGGGTRGARRVRDLPLSTRALMVLRCKIHFYASLLWQGSCRDLYIIIKNGNGTFMKARDSVYDGSRDNPLNLEGIRTSQIFTVCNTGERSEPEFFLIKIR